MTVKQLLTSVNYVTDETGQRKAVQLDLAVWEEIRAIVEAYTRQFDPAERTRAYEFYYATRSPEDETEEQELVADFALVEPEIADESL